MTRFAAGDVVLFMVASDPRLVAVVGQPVRVLRAGIFKDDRLGYDADGTALRAGADYDYMIELQGGFWRGLAHDWQLAPLDGPPTGSTRTTPEPA